MHTEMPGCASGWLLLTDFVTLVCYVLEVLLSVVILVEGFCVTFEVWI